MSDDPSLLLPLARRRPYWLGTILGCAQLSALGMVALKISYEAAPAGLVGPGGSELLLTHEVRAIFGYFALVVVGIIGTVAYVKFDEPRFTLRLTAASAALANAIALALGDLLALAVPGLVFALIVLAAEALGRRNPDASGA